MEIHKVNYAITEQEPSKHTYRKTPFNRQPLPEESPSSLSEELSRLGIVSTPARVSPRQWSVVESPDQAHREECKQVTKLIQYILEILENFDDQDHVYFHLYPLIEESDVDDKLGLSLTVDLPTAKVELILALRQVHQEILDELELDQLIVPQSFKNIRDLVKLAKEWDAAIKEDNYELLKIVAGVMIQEPDLLGRLIANIETYVEEVLRHLFSYGMSEELLQAVRAAQILENQPTPLLLLVMLFCEEGNKEEALRVAEYLDSQEMKEATKRAIEQTFASADQSSRKELFLAYLNFETMVTTITNSDDPKTIKEVINEGCPDQDTKSLVLLEGVKASLELPMQTPQVKKVIAISKQIPNREVKKDAFAEQFKHHLIEGNAKYARQVHDAAPFPSWKKTMGKTLTQVEQLKKKKG